MIYTIKPGSGNLNWSAHGVDRILQNVQNLLSLAAYEVAFDRTRGLPTSLMDMLTGKVEPVVAAMAHTLGKLHFQVHHQLLHLQLLG